MLAYKIVRCLRHAWRAIDITVEEGIDELTSICSLLLSEKKPLIQLIPKPGKISQALLESVDVVLPKILPARGINVATRKNLVEDRQAT